MNARSLCKFLESIRDVEVMSRFYMRMDNQTLMELMELLDQCNVDTKNRWIYVYNSITNYRASSCG